MTSHRAPAPRKGASKLIADFVGTLGTRVGTMGIGLFTGILSARLLGPEDRGIFALVALFPSTLVTLTKFGQAQAVIYFIRREKVDVSALASNAVTFGVMVGAVLMAVVLGMRESLVSTVLGGVPVWALVVVSPLIPILLIESYLYGVLQATDRFKVYNTRIMVDNIQMLVLMFTFLYVCGWGLAGALAALMINRTVMFVWVVWTISGQTPIRLHFDVDLFRRTLRYGLKSHIQIIASHFHFRAAIYVVALYLTPTQVAFYSIGARLAERIMYVPQSLGLAMFPRLAGAEEARVHSMTAMAVRQTIAVCTVAAVAMTLLGPWLITFFYGQAYADAAVPLRYVAWGIVMMAAYVLLSRNFTSRDRQRVNIVAAYIALIGNLVLNFALVPTMGIEGAAIATASAYSVAASILYVFFLRESGLAWHSGLVMRPSDIAMWWGVASGMAGRLRARVVGSAG